MYPIPPNEHLVETRTCRHCGTSFPTTDKDLEFYDKVSPTFNGKKYSIPTPTLCPDCRQQRRLSFRNERKLYKRKCDATGKDIVSIYSPDKPYKVYHQDFWWSDGWNPMDYGREFDFGRGFFEQFLELLEKVAVPALYNQSSENSEYTNYAANNKNCYLTSSFVGECEDCSYGNFLVDCQDSIDCSHVQHSQNCYQCIDTVSCSHVFYSDNIFHSNNSYYLSHCTNCSYCFGCVNLVGKKFYIYNKPYSEKDYFVELQKLLTMPLSKNFSNFISFKNSLPQKNINISESENVIGDYVFHGKDIMNGFDLYDGENIRYSVSGSDAKDCQDCTWFGYDGTSMVYESANFTGSRSIFSCISWFVTDVMYCMNCFNSKNLFGCAGLHNNAFYCILNKQYTKEEYEKLVPQIIEHMMKNGEWGEFFPSSMSPFGYNETVAQEYYPLTKEEATKNGVFNWSDYETPFPKVEKIIDKEGMKKLPEDITKIPDDILNWALTCEVTEKPFRIIKQELDFYRKHHLPIPRRHPDQRHLDRMTQRNPRKLFERKCDKCHKPIITTYSPDRPEIVYCEECYNREVVG